MHSHARNLVAVCLFAGSLAVHAETITYSESALVSGSLNGVSFTDSELVITGTADTGMIVNEGGGLYQLNIPLEGMLAGFGSFSLSGDSIFSSEAGDIGGVVRGSSLLLSTFSTGFDPYALGGAIGPLTGQATLSSSPVATSDGALDLTASGVSTFQATVVTPEPASLLLLGTGLLFAVGLGRGLRRPRAAGAPRQSTKDGV